MSRYKKRKKHGIGECVYCGKLGSLTDDHIPPQNLFPKPHPHNMISVPACYECNNRASKDDEYFRLCLTIIENAKGHPARDSIIPSVERSLGKKEAVGFSNAIWNEIIDADRFSPSGLLYLGPGKLHVASLTRMNRVAVRIVKGLLYNETQQRIPDNFVVFSWHLSMLSKLELDTDSRQVIEAFIDALLTVQPQRIGDVFAFSRIWSPDGWPGSSRSVWLLQFYGRIEYYCSICPREVETVAPLSAHAPSKGGKDDPSNMQGKTVEAAKAKDKIEGRGNIINGSQE
ncbi:MAG: hypothetical protein ABSA46_10225 [Thermodesulfovibrionales bacterium]